MDGEAGAELLCALLEYRVRETEDLAVVAARRLKLGLELGECLIRTRGAAALARLPDLDTLDLSPWEYRTIFVLLSDGNADALSTALRAAVAHGSARAVGGALLHAFEDGVWPAADALQAALGSSRSGVRAAALYFLSLHDKDRLTPELRAAALAPPAEGAEAPSEDERLARELAGRRMGRAPTPIPDWEAWLASERAVAEPFPMALLRGRLRPAEAKAWDASNRREGGPYRHKSRPADLVSYRADHQRSKEMWTPQRYPSGFVAGLLRTTGCRSSARPLGAPIPFGEDGIPQAAIQPATASACDQAGAALLATARPPWDRATRSGRKETVVIPDVRILSCLAEETPEPEPSPSPTPSSVHRSAPPRVRAPRRTRNVEPDFPASMRGLSGRVVLRADISTTGCVRGVVVERSAGTDFDLAALVAVSQWAYTPTLLDGVPSPVIMTVSVQFR
jgi:TonB family protein